MDTVTLDAGATLGPHGVILPGGVASASGATVGPGLARAARRRRAGRHPLDRQPDRALDGAGVGAAPPVAARSPRTRRRRGRPLPARPRQRRLRRQPLRPRPRLPGRQQPADGPGPAARAPRPQRLDRLSLDLAGLRVAKVLVDGRRAAAATPSGRASSPSGSAAPVRRGRRARRRRPVRRARPRPRRGTWGEVGWEELTDGVHRRRPARRRAVVVPVQRPPERQGDATASPSTADAGVPRRGQRRRSTERPVDAEPRRAGCYEQPEPMATYLATVQIGRYEVLDGRVAPVRQLAAVPAAAAARRSGTTSAASREMMALFERLFGPYPFADYTVVVTDDDLEIPLEAQGLSVFGAQPPRRATRVASGSSPTSWRTSGSATASPSRRWQDIWLHEGFACYAEWLWSEALAAARRPTSSRAGATSGWPALPQDLVVGDPGPRADVRRPRLQARRPDPARPAARRSATTRSSRCCGRGRRRTRTAPPSPTTSSTSPPGTPRSHCTSCSAPGCSSSRCRRCRQPVMVPAAWVTSLTGSRRAAEPVVVSGNSRRTRVFAAHAGR